MKKIEYRAKLFLLFVAWFAFWAYNPHYFSDWALENVLTLLFIALRARVAEHGLRIDPRGE